MAPLKIGDTFPENVKFSWAPILDNNPNVCGIPQEYDASKEFRGKKVVLVSMPGAFTPTCSETHLPNYIKKYAELKKHGVDLVVIITYNDAFIMNAWGKANKVAPDTLLLMSDTVSSFSQSYAWKMGERTGRWAMIIEKDGKISYVENEGNPAVVTVSGVDAVLSKL